MIQSNTQGAAPSIFDALPDIAFIREAQLVQSPKRPDSPAPPTLQRADPVAQGEGGHIPQAAPPV